LGDEEMKRDDDMRTQREREDGGEEDGDGEAKERRRDGGERGSVEKSMERLHQRRLDWR
jgi:hypothetical protein